MVHRPNRKVRDSSLSFIFSPFSNWNHVFLYHTRQVSIGRDQRRTMVEDAGVEGEEEGERWMEVNAGAEEEDRCGC